MRTSRAIFIPAAVLALAAAAFGQPWDAQITKLRELERQKHWDDILTQTSEMLGKYADDKQVETIYQWRGTAYESAQRWDAIVAEADVLDKAAVGAKKPLLAQVLADYAGRLHRHQKAELAVQVYRMIVERCPGESERCAWARIGIGDCYLWQMKDAQPKALAEFLAVERDYPDQTTATIAALQRLSDNGAAMKDLRASADACGRAVHERRSSYDAESLERFAIRRGEYLTALQDWDGAIQAYREAEDAFARTDATKSDMAQRQATLTQQHLGAEQAVLPLERVIACHGAAAANQCQDALRRLVDIHILAKRHGVAAQFARLGLDTGDRDWSLGKIVECLKALDPTNARLEAFLAREIDGVKRADGQDRADVLAEIGYPAWPEETTKAFERSLADLGDDWRSLRRKGRVCLYWGRPREATGYFYRAFLSCSIPQELVKVRIDLIEDAYHGVYGTHVGAERWQRLFCPSPQDAPPDEDVADLFKRDHPVADASAVVNEALAALELCLARPYPIGANPQDVARDREVYLDAYSRIAIEKGREDDLIRFCRAAIEKENLTGLYDDFVLTALVMCRMRDGNAEGDFKLLEELNDGARTPALVAQARHVVQTALSQLHPLHNPIVSQPQIYRRYLPPPPKKTR